MPTKGSQSKKKPPSKTATKKRPPRPPFNARLKTAFERLDAFVGAIGYMLPEDATDEAAALKAAIKDLD